MKMEQTGELSQEMIFEKRMAKIEEDIAELKIDVDLAIQYVRALALENLGAERIAELEKRARAREERRLRRGETTEPEDG